MMFRATASGRSKTFAIPGLWPVDQLFSMVMPAGTRLSRCHDTSTSRCSTPAATPLPVALPDPRRKNLILAIVEEPELGMVVGLGRRYRDAQPKRVRGDHPRQAVKRMTGERPGGGASLDEDIRHECSCLFLPSFEPPRSTAPRSAGNRAGATVNSIGSVSSRVRWTAKPGASCWIQPAVNQPKAPRTVVAARNPGIRMLRATRASGKGKRPGFKVLSSVSTARSLGAGEGCVPMLRLPLENRLSGCFRLRGRVLRLDLPRW